MKNITISLDDEILKAGREYAKRHNTSLNSLIRKLLAQTVLPKSQNWLEEGFIPICIQPYNK
jgi:plasmid stability protein